MRTLRVCLVVGALLLWGHPAAAQVVYGNQSTGSGTQALATRTVEASDSDLVTDTDAIRTAVESSATSLDNIETNLSADAVHDNAAIATGPQVMGEAKDFDGSALPNAVTEGDAGRIAVTLSGMAYSFLTNEGGTKELGKLEDDAHASADYAMPVLGRRIDTLAPSSGTSGDYETPNYSAQGAAWVTPSATTNGGCTPGSSISAGAVLETEIKATAGQLYSIVITNVDATTVFARLYNDTAANTDENDTPIQRFAVPTSGGFVLPIPVGAAFSTAITLRVTTGAADTDTGALTANEVFVSYCYK